MDDFLPAFDVSKLQTVFMFFLETVSSCRYFYVNGRFALTSD